MGIMFRRSARGRKLRPVGEWWIASPLWEKKTVDGIAQLGISKATTGKGRKKIKITSLLPSVLTLKKQKSKPNAERKRFDNNGDAGSITESPGCPKVHQRAECGAWREGARSCNLCSRGECRVRRRLHF